jgi:hypothetical protein
MSAGFYLEDESGVEVTHGSLLHEAFTCVRNLCLSFPISCEPDNIVFSPLRSTSSHRMRDFLARYEYSAELEWLDAVNTMIDSVDTSFDVLCRFGHASETKMPRIAGSLQAWKSL